MERLPTEESLLETGLEASAAAVPSCFQLVLAAVKSPLPLVEAHLALGPHSSQSYLTSAFAPFAVAMDCVSELVDLLQEIAPELPRGLTDP